MHKMIITTIKTLIIMIFLLSSVLFSDHSSVLSQEIDECIECHTDIHLTRVDDSGTLHSLYVDKKAFLGSVHAEMEYTCVECHEGVKTDSHPKEGIPDVKCGGCHEEALKEYEKSRHGMLLKAGNPNAPQCYDCHSMHDVLTADNPASSVHPDNLSTTCGKCHKDEAHDSLLSFIATRVKGHGKVNMSCDFSTRRCTDCHFDVGRHGNDELKPKKCVNCHGVPTDSFLFGKIHKSDIFKSPFFIVLLICCYLAAISGIIFYFKTRIL